MKLHDLKPARGSRTAPKRVGRGMGSGWGRTAGRGDKGQKSRRGYSRKPGFEGGQMPLHRRLPKRGFTNIFRRSWAAVNVGRLTGFAAERPVTPELLKEKGLLPRGAELVKILGVGELSAGLTVRAHGFSKSATAKIEAAGGKAEVLPVPQRGPRKATPGGAEATTASTGTETSDS
jgi:large subunit ribosomal protein L15